MLKANALAYESCIQVTMSTADPGSEDWEPYLSVAAQGDVDAVGKLLDNEDGISAALGGMLRTASYHGHLETIKLLVSRGADVNAHDDDGETALLAAVCGAQAETTQLLIENGANVHTRLPGGASALHQAVTTDQATNTGTMLEIVDQLLEKGLAIDDRDDDGHTALHEASLYGRVDLMNGLIARGANVNAKDKWQDTPLDRACLNGYTDAVKCLVSHQAEINTHSGGCEGLSRAVRNGHLELSTFLLNNGAKALPVSSGGPELLYAARSGVSEMIHLLVDREFSSQGPRSLLRAASMDSVQVVAQLVAHGVSVDVKNSKQQTLLHLAVLGKRMERQTSHGVSNSRNEVIKFLIEKGVDVNAVDAYGKTALDLAMQLGYSDAAEILILWKR